ncbi:MAG: alcohol dehydrogenase catalytic domain-containing protein [Candidatus Thermoplasmatota archaeon]|nr:alcohol dehydrogenase catalytic domain-containing protein [Candidatus Thermoplasmatota archaeon]MBU1914199.1 alcohol dehydrogenase catalytic domain-containing protein [Candidatus Thermoplasmatota archaeon]
MRVAMYYRNSDVRLQEMPKPEIDRSEMLVKVIASGICGSDVMEWYRIKRAPLVLGHEIAGDIVEVGRDVDQYKVGQRVFVSHHVPCMKCRYCLAGHTSTCDTLRTTNFYPGGFAEFVRVPEINLEHGVYVLPKELTYDDGSFIEPLACCVRGFRQSRYVAGMTVLVLGSGIAGLLNVKLAKAYGAGRVLATDISKFRLDTAKRSGADAAFDARGDVPKLVRDANAGRPADFVIVCVGSVSAIDQAFKSVDRGGTVLIFAPPMPGTQVLVPFGDLWKDEITITFTYAGGPRDLEEAIELLRTKKVVVSDMITHRFGLADAQKGFELVARAGDSMKVIIDPQK